MLITLLAVATLAAATGYFTFTIVAGPSPAKVRAMENLRRGTQSKAAVAAHPATSSGTGRNVSTLSKTLVPTGSRTRLEKMLARAGRPTDWPIERLIQVKLALTVAAPILATMSIFKAPSPLLAGLGVRFAAILFFLPELRMYSVGVERRGTV